MRMYRLKNGTIGECSMVNTIMLTIRDMSVFTVLERANARSYGCRFWLILGAGSQN